MSPPDASPPRPVIHLRVPGTRRHLHFFRKMVKKPEKFIEAGAIVDVVDRGGQPIGCGFYNPKSEIAVRMLGMPEDGLVEKRLRAALAFRESLRIDADAYRVCHSEGDGLSGLVVDRFADVHSVEIFSLGMLKQMEVVRKFLPKVFVQADERTQALEGFRLPPEKPPEGVLVREHGVEFRVDFARGHKTGFFCDQRENRKAVAELARGKELLDLCCYTGGFAVSAAKAGARRVTAVDLDEEALETARQNARLNRVKVDYFHQDIFNYLRQCREKFDIVVLDPPKMAREREDLPKAKRGYLDMNRLAAQVVKPGGVLVSCSCTGLVSEEEFLSIVRWPASASSARSAWRARAPTTPSAASTPRGATSRSSTAWSCEPGNRSARPVR